MNKQFNSVLRLRRDNDYNYAKIADTFIPANGEICLITMGNGTTRMICGDGSSTFNKLSYVDERLIKGYFNNNNFFEDNLYTKKILPILTDVYLDLNQYHIYIYDGQAYRDLSSVSLPTASAEIAGAVKLYSTTGQNTDGTMTQKAISDELDDKIEMLVIPEEETLKLDYDLI